MQGYNISLDGVWVEYSGEADSPERISKDHCHDRYEIIYTAFASGRYIVEGSEYDVRPRTLMLIRPLAYHHVDLDEEAGYEGYSIQFQKCVLTDRVAIMLDRIIDNTNDSGRYYSPEAVCDALISVFDRLSFASELSSDEQSAYVEMLLSEIIILLSAADGERITHSEEQLGARVSRYLNGNIEKNISLDKLARRFFVSKYYLCRAFKEYSGISVHSYINHKRIMYAKQLIESGITASHAAERVGFGDYSAFYRAYVKIVGKSPAAN